jgi:hypothetical protein
MPRLLVYVAALTTALTAPATEAAALNKCIDAQGGVTYSNLPCRDAREVRKVEIDPPPLPDPAPVKSTRPDKPAKSAKPAAAPAPAGIAPSATITPPAVRVDTQTRGTSSGTSGKPARATHLSPRQCDSLSDKLGKILDAMDQARRSGYTQAQMDAWSREVKDIETKKQQSGCF